MSFCTPNENMYVYLIPTMQCNLRHSFCFQRSFSSVKLSDEILYEKLKPLYERTACLRLHGGELTTVPKMKDFVRFLGENYPKMIINLVTNGVQFDAQWASLADKYNVIVNYSLNTISEEATEKILPSLGNVKKVHKKIHDNLASLVKIHNASQKNIINTITMAVCEETLSEIVLLAREGLKYGLNVTYQFPCEEGACISKNILNAVYLVAKMQCFCKNFISIKFIHAPLQNKMADMIEEIELAADFANAKKAFFAELSFTPQKNKQGSILTYEDYIFQGPDAFTCPRPWKGLFINSLGDVLPCSNAPGYVLGNIYETEIEDILISPARLALQEEIRNNRYTHCWKSCNTNYFPETSGSKVVLEEVLSYKKLFDEGRYEQVAALLSAVLEANGGLSADALYMLAFSCHITKRHEAALQHYKAALSSGFSEFWVRYNRGSLLLDLERPDEAKADLARAHELDPHHEGARQQLAAAVERMPSRKTGCKN